MKLFHFSNKIKPGPDGKAIVKVNGDRNYYSRREFSAWDEPRSFWYTNESDKESIVNGQLFVADVDEDDLLDFRDVNFDDFRETISWVDFGKLKAHALGLGKIGFKYRVGFEVVVLFQDVEVSVSQ